jgi:RNA polymerase sigma-70 factor, ECF subfamily
MLRDPVSGAREAQDEASIVWRVAGGDREAFVLLMRRYNRRLFRLARATLGDATEAEDAVQDAYLDAYRAMGGFRGASSLSTWLCRLVLNQCLARQRRTHRRENVVPIVSSESHRSSVDGVVDDAELPERAYDRSQMRRVLEQKVAELPEIFRVAFVLRSVEELSVQEAALILGIPEDTVRSRHFRAKGLLRESLARDVDLAERDLFEFAGAQCEAVTARVLERLTSPSATLAKPADSL